jgi:hypothetical protein
MKEIQARKERTTLKDVQLRPADAQQMHNLAVEATTRALTRR